MYLKNPNNTPLRFFIEDPILEKEITVPLRGTAPSLQALSRMVMQQVAEFQRATGGKFTKNAEAEAKSLGLQISNFWNKVIQHQICLRAGGDDPMRICYNDGYGDAFHEFAGKIDDMIEKAPKPIKAIGKAIVGAALRVANKGKKSGNRVRGCSGCGGTRTFRMGDKSTLGRVAKFAKKPQ